ncbi:MAG: urea carboxylase-associated family protein [Devosia sp.]
MGAFWPSKADLAATNNTTLQNPVSPDGTPVVGERYTVPARQGLAVRVGRGERVRVINTEGTQVVDAWAFNAADPGEFMSMPHVRAAINGIIPQPPAPLVSNKRQPILTFEEDTSPGVHDTLIAACDIWRYRGLGVEVYHDSCTDNLRLALKAIGFDCPEVPSPFNLFMNIPVGAGNSIDWLPPTSRPGDSVTFRADMDVIFVVSACPQDIIPINGEACVPTHAQLMVLAGTGKGTAADSQR